MPKNERPAGWRGDHALFRSYSLEVDEFSEGSARLHAVCAERFGNRGSSTLHGGAYGGLGACAAELASATVIPAGSVANVLEYRVQIFRPLAVGTTAHCLARVLHRGRRYLGLSVDITDDAGKQSALFTGTFAVESSERTTPPADGPGTYAPRELSRPKYDYEKSESWTTFGVRVEETGPGYGKVSSFFDPQFVGYDGELHPAFIAAVADSVTVPACATVKAEDENYATLEYKVNFLQPVLGGSLLAEGHVVDRDHRAFVVDVSVLDETGQRCAKMLTSLAVLRSGGAETRRD